LINNTSNKEVEERVNEQLIALGIINLKNKKTCLLSGGEKQRVCIARALINNPKIILADEPCGNLDSKNSKNIMDILLSLKKEGKIIILVTHNEADAKRCDRIIRLCDGQIV
ncbi:MAG: ATP-binding cassette domain-containing protein, partial [Erysipelotrichaceae bacterium]